MDLRFVQVTGNDVFSITDEGARVFFVNSWDYHRLCEEAGIDGDDPSDFADNYDFTTVLAVQNIGGEDGWLCVY